MIEEEINRNTVEEKKQICSNLIENPGTIYSRLNYRRSNKTYLQDNGTTKMKCEYSIKKQHRNTQIQYSFKSLYSQNRFREVGASSSLNVLDEPEEQTNKCMRDK